MTYEITFITKEEKDPVVKKTIESLGGKIKDHSSLGRRKLAYPIQKEKVGVYTTYLFDLTTDKIEDLNKKLKLEKEILRYLIIQKTEKPTEKLKKEEKPAKKTKKITEKVAKPVKEKIKEAPKPLKKEVKEIEVTEKERLKALEDKLSELLKE